jgi:chromosome segregation ATPase
MDLKALIGLLKTPKTPSAVLREQLDSLPTAIQTAERQADELEADRRTILLEGTDADLAAIEDKIVQANRDAERLHEAKRVLERRLAEAEKQEAEDALSTERDATEKESADVAKQIGSEYPKLARRLTEMLQRLVDAEEQVEAINAKLSAAGRGDERLDGPERRIFPKAANPNYQFWHLGAEIRLPHFADQWAPGWGDVPQGFMDRKREAA